MIESPIHGLLKQLYNKGIRNSYAAELLQPRRINPPGGYSALLEVPTLAFEGLIIAKQIAREPPTLRQSVTTINYMLIREGMPIYFAAEDFIRAVAATELPEDIRVDELYWPRTAFVLALPTRFMRGYIGQDIGYVTVANIKKGEYSLVPMLHGYPVMVVPVDKFCLHTIIWNPSQNQVENAIIAWWQSDFLAQAAKRWAYTDMAGSDDETIRYKKETNDLLGNLVLKLLLILSTNVGYIVEGQKIRERKLNRKGLVEQSELWSANLIGGNYKIKGKRADGTYTPHEGFIKRSGHFTHQFIGARDPDIVSTESLPKLSTGEIDWVLVPEQVKIKFWANHKRIWIQPVWYNPAEAK